MPKRTKKLYLVNEEYYNYEDSYAQTIGVYDTEKAASDIVNSLNKKSNPDHYNYTVKVFEINKIYPFI